MRLRPQRKVFCIGPNKTGTTSLASALRQLGFRVGDQAQAELFLEDWGRRDFRRVVRHCRSADAFLDVPFSLAFTYAIVDQAFPGSRFVLTVRDSPDEWFQSLTRFHTQVVGKNRLPTADDLKQFAYRKRGWLWRTHELAFGGELYDRDRYTAVYQAHVDGVIEYFRNRPDDLLVLNLGVGKPAQALCRFLDLDEADLTMPHLNRSETPG